jgi:hypothetical protein
MITLYAQTCWNEALHDGGDELTTSPQSIAKEAQNNALRYCKSKKHDNRTTIRSTNTSASVRITDKGRAFIYRRHTLFAVAFSVLLATLIRTLVGLWKRS